MACATSTAKKCEDVGDLKQKMYSMTRNTNKRLKRRDETINKQKTCIDSQLEKIKQYERATGCRRSIVQITKEN